MRRLVLLRSFRQTGAERYAQIAQMEVELPSMPVSIRQTYQGKLAGSRQALEKVKQALVSSSYLSHL